MNKTIKVAVVEDDEYLRSNLAGLIEKTDDMKLVGAYQDGPSALKGIPQVKPDVVVMDIQLPGVDGVECVRELKSALPKVDFLMLTAYADTSRLFESLKAGAGGYLLKRFSQLRVLQAIRELHAGGSPMTPQIARQVVEFISSQSGAAKSSFSDLTHLTPAQKKTMEELSQGYSYKEIAEHLGISVDGVRNHIRKIYDKLHVHSKVEAVNKFFGR
jgi:DNA-binding NarL/FixJ family response regulator